MSSSLEFLKETICTQLESMQDKIYPMLRNFPKSEMHVTSASIRNSLREAISKINQSFKVPSKRLSYAQEADGYLEVLKSDLCLSRRQRFISIGVYDELLTTIFNISKNINSYIKQIKTTPKINK